MFESDSGFRIGGTTLSKSHGQFLIQKVDNPFVVSVVAIPRAGGTFLTEWWVTGPTSPEFGASPPILLLHSFMGIRCDQEELENQVSLFWAERLQELTFASAIADGVSVDTKRLRELNPHTQEKVVLGHLQGHEYLRQFPGPNKPVRATLTMRTAFMYVLLRSMGVGKVQQIIADFESSNVAGRYGELQKGEDINVSTETINQRLVHARRLGLLEVLDPLRRGRAPSSSKQVKDFAEKHKEEFASNQNQETGKEGANHEHKEK